MNNKNIIRNIANKGSILLEALLSIIILSTSISLIIQAMTSSLRSARYSADYTEAMILLENKIFDSWSKGFIALNAVGGETLDNNVGRFIYSIDVSRFDDNVAKDNIKKVYEINRVNYKILWGNGIKKRKLILSTFLFEKIEK